MYIDNFKLFENNEKELETLIQTIRTYTQDRGMEFGAEKCTMLIMKGRKDIQRKEYNYQTRKQSECLERRKTTSTLEY